MIHAEKKTSRMRCPNRMRCAVRIALLLVTAILQLQCISSSAVPNQKIKKDECLEEHFYLRLKIKDIREEYRASQAAVFGTGCVFTFGTAAGLLVYAIGMPLTWLKYRGRIERASARWKELKCNEDRTVHPGFIDRYGLR